MPRPTRERLKEIRSQACPCCSSWDHLTCPVIKELLAEVDALEDIIGQCEKIQTIIITDRDRAEKLLKEAADILQMNLDSYTMDPIDFINKYQSQQGLMHQFEFAKKYKKTLEKIRDPRVDSDGYLNDLADYIEGDVVRDDKKRCCCEAPDKPSYFCPIHGR